MSVASATPLMIDTGAFYARADSDDTHHETATRVFERIRTGDLPYRPLYTTQAVLAEVGAQTDRVGLDVGLGQPRRRSAELGRPGPDPGESRIGAGSPLTAGRCADNGRCDDTQKQTPQQQSSPVHRPCVRGAQ